VTEAHPRLSCHTIDENRKKVNSAVVTPSTSAAARAPNSSADLRDSSHDQADGATETTVSSLKTTTRPQMRRLPRWLLVAPVLLALAVAALAFIQYQRSTPATSVLTLSGTIEATQVRVASQWGGQVEEVLVDEGTPVNARQSLARLYRVSENQNELVVSPLNGVVLERLVEPGELVVPDAPLLVVANLDALTLRVYVPEDRYGQLTLGATYPVTVDSFPDETFSGTLARIADQAQFTPRNVQTVEGRRSTVFAATLKLAPSRGKLKPGMPADVHLVIGQAG
jgi:HlyD family secretion protein